MNTHTYAENELRQIVNMIISLMGQSGISVDMVNDEIKNFIVNELALQLNKRQLLFD
jgi:hypothetical protein